MKLTAIMKQYDYKSIEEFEAHKEKLRHAKPPMYLIGDVGKFTIEPDSHGNMYTATFSTDIL